VSDLMASMLAAGLPSSHNKLKVLVLDHNEFMHEERSGLLNVVHIILNDPFHC